MSAQPVMTAGLVGIVNASRATGASIAVSPSSRKAGLNAMLMSSPVEAGVDRLRGLRLLPRPCLEHALAAAERQPYRGVALGDEGTPA